MKVKLEELVEEVSERTTVNNQHPVLTSSRSGIYLQEEYFKKQVASKDNTGYRIIRKGEFTYRAMSDTGEFYPNKLECTDIGIVSPAYPVFKIKDNRILPDYLRYYFRSRLFQKSITAFVQGSTRASMKFGKMKLISIDLPDKDKQNQIINTIGILESIIDKYKLEIDRLNNLIKARFVEMFDDNFDEIVELGNVCDVRDGTHDSPKYHNEGYPLVTSKNICDGKIDFSTCNLIQKEDYAKINKRSKVDIGDVLMPMIGTVGNPIIVNTDKEFAIKNVALIKFKDDSVILNTFIKTLFESDYFGRAVLSKTKGGTQKFISLGDIRKLEFNLPPIELQHRFATFVAQVDKSKFALSNELAMCNFYVRLINDSITHSRIDLRMSE